MSNGAIWDKHDLKTPSIQHKKSKLLPTSISFNLLQDIMIYCKIGVNLMCAQMFIYFFRKENSELKKLRLQHNPRQFSTPKWHYLYIKYLMSFLIVELVPVWCVHKCWCICIFSYCHKAMIGRHRSLRQGSNTSPDWKYY